MTGLVEMVEREVTGQLARFVLATGLDDLPASVRRKPTNGLSLFLESTLRTAS